MNRNVGIATGVGIAIIFGVIIFQVNETMWQQVSVDEYYDKGGKVSSVVYPDNPQILGPLQINKDKYLLGENVYIIIRDLRPQDQGEVQFFTPEGILYESMGFNGEVREYQKKYFKPQLLKSKNLCEKSFQLDSSYIPAVNNLSRIYFKMNEREKCMESALHALKLQPNGFICLLNKALALSINGEIKEGIAILENLKELNQTDDLLNQLALMYEVSGNIKQSNKYLIESFKLNNIINCFDIDSNRWGTSWQSDGSDCQPHILNNYYFL